MRKMILSLALALTIAACVGVSSADAQRWRRWGGYYYGYPTYSYPTYVYPNGGYSNYSYYYAPDYGTYYEQPGYYYSAPGYYSGPSYYYPNYWRGYRWWRR
jgi:hypothetical protein